MANLRKLVAAALNAADLSNDPLIETAIDRIGALAFSDPLGGELWALKYAGDARSWPRCLSLLSQRSKRIAPERNVRTNLCRCCLIEWIDENCRACGGRRIVAATPTSTAHICTVCNGTGLRRYSDLWRMREMRMDRRTLRKWEHRFAAVHNRITDADLQAWRDLQMQLGRAPAQMIRERVLDNPRRLATIDDAALERPAQNSNSMPDFTFSSTASA